MYGAGLKDWVYLDASRKQEHRVRGSVCLWSTAIRLLLLQTMLVACYERRRSEVFPSKQTGARNAVTRLRKNRPSEGRMWTQQRRRPRAFVCITGQLSRLELDGKIDNLFQPLYNTHDIDVAFVLSTGKATFVAKRNDRIFHGAVPTYSTFKEVRAKIPRKFGMVRTQQIEQPESPILVSEYVDLLDKNSLNHTLKEERSRSHIRQWYVYQKCLGMMDRFEKVVKKRYSIVMRMREDLFIAHPVDIDFVLENVWGKILLVQRCDSWGGMNDKLVILHRGTAVKYFTTPLQQFYLHPQAVFNFTGGGRVTNPETFLLRAFERVGIKVVPISGEKLLGVPIRSSTSGACFPLGLRSLSCLRRQVGQDVMLYLQRQRCT